MYIHIHINICTYIYIYKYTHICECVCLCMCVCLPIEIVCATSTFSSETSFVFSLLVSFYCFHYHRLFLFPFFIPSQVVTLTTATHKLLVFNFSNYSMH